MAETLLPPEPNDCGSIDRRSAGDVTHLRSMFEALVGSESPRRWVLPNRLDDPSQAGSLSADNRDEPNGTAASTDDTASDIASDTSCGSDVSRRSGLSDRAETRRLKQQAIMEGKLSRLATAPFSAIEHEVSRAFVHPDHVRAIGVAAQTGKFAVSFRETGEATLQCLAEGAPAKGHDILEKSIKESSVRNAEGGEDPERLQALVDAGIEGRVGHWSGNRLIGIHMDPATWRFAESATPEKRDLAALLQRAPGGNPYYPVDEGNLECSLAPLKAVDDWKSLPFTGDLDTHDMVSMQGHRSPVASGSDEEKRIAGCLNTGIAFADARRPVQKPNHVLIQHGPSHNYVAHMMTEEKGEAISGPVARADFPVAMCDRGTWSMIRSENELNDFYSRHGIELKSTWKKEAGLGFEAVGEGNVRLRRNSSSSDEGF